MRIDKFLSHSGYGSRKEVKSLLKQKRVEVDNQIIKDAKFSVDVANSAITVDGDRVFYQEFYYYMLNKPAGVISATEDNFQETVMDLFNEQDYRADLAPVGRLDKDTEGLLLITNDGKLNHQLLSPRHHVEKEYYALIEGIVTKEDQKVFARGMMIDNGEECMPAELKIIRTETEKNESQIQVVVCEGKFHQVKRMFQAVGKRVVHLKRLRMGSLDLDSELELGSYRALNSEEVAILKSNRVSE